MSSNVDEPWCEALIYPRTSAQSEIERQKLPFATHSTDNNFTGISPNEYFADLINDNTTLNAALTPTESSENDKEAAPAQVIRGVISKKQVKKLPLLDQIKVFLKDGKASMSLFSRLKLVNLCSKNFVLQSTHGNALGPATVDRESLTKFDACWCHASR
jgi:hypothetical protein